MSNTKYITQSQLRAQKDAKARANGKKKPCSNCQKKLTLDNFRKRSGRLAHLYVSWCKACERESNRAYAVWKKGVDEVTGSSPAKTTTRKPAATKALPKKSARLAKKDVVSSKNQNTIALRTTMQELGALKIDVTSNYSAYKTAKKSPTFEQFCDELGLSPAQGRARLETIKAAGIKVDLLGERITLTLPEPREDVQDTGIAPTVGVRQRVAVISDTHYGSKFCLRNAIKDFIAYAYGRGVREVLHSGDVMDGDYNHAKFEMTHMGLNAQLNDLVENLPQHEGLTYHGITGNHDFTFTDRAGVDVGRAIADTFAAHGRSDFKMYGDRGAYLRIRGGLFHLWHPSGGGSYASCYSDDTDVLTQAGWKNWSSVTMDDTFATLNERHEVEWHKAEALHSSFYHGVMLQTNSRLVDLCVTPNHNLYVRKDRAHEGWRLQEAQECEKTWMRYDDYQGNWRMKKNAQPQVGPKPEFFDIPEVAKRHNKPVKHLGRVDMKTFLSFLGHWISEGSMSDRGEYKNTGGRLCQSQRVNPDVHSKMMDEVECLGLSPVADEKGVTFTSRELAEVLFEECGRGSYNIHVPQWVKELDASLLRIFFEAYMEGDGTEDVKGHCSAITVSSRLADDLQEIALKLGFSAAVHWSEKSGRYGAFSISFNEFKNEPRLDRDILRIPYEGMVYCATVPNHTLYVRRNGKAVWSGNSYKLQKKIEAYAPGEKPQVLLVGHYHRFCHIEERGVHGVLCPTFQGGTSAFGKSLCSGGPSIGGLILEWDMTADGTMRNLSVEKRTYFEKEVVHRIETRDGYNVNTLNDVAPTR